MMKQVDDGQVFRDMCGETSPEDISKMQRVLEAWATALDKLDEANDVRTVFLACVQTIGTMGPAYCEIAAATLLQRARSFADEE